MILGAFATVIFAYADPLPGAFLLAMFFALSWFVDDIVAALVSPPLHQSPLLRAASP
jgi:hypothetical protein